VISIVVAQWFGQLGGRFQPPPIETSTPLSMVTVLQMMS
jgi:hypothetical protein